MHDSKKKQQEIVDKMEKKDPATVPQAAVIETTTIKSQPQSPIIIKIEQPKQATKQLKDKNATENPEILAKHILCALLFIATFATVMTFLWHYLDPSGMFNYHLIMLFFTFRSMLFASHLKVQLNMLTF